MGAMNAFLQHIEKPEESAAFQKFPKILANHHASNMICDYLRMGGMNADAPDISSATNVLETASTVEVL